MKKIIGVILAVFLLMVGCENMNNTPTAVVENFLNSYQNLDSDVRKELEDKIEEDSSMSEGQKEIYKSLLEKQYQNLSYKIRKEEVDEDTATVEVEIEVLDYKRAITDAEAYYKEHPEEFLDTEEDNNNVSLGEMAKEKIEDAKNYIDYKMQEMQNVADKEKYTLTFYLNKEDNIWTIEDLTDEDMKKLHGLY